jgi:glycosyltransferase involved in cell wall biosynthesis
MNIWSQSTNTVAVIAYYFPPEGSAGVYRPLRFLNELVRKGWRATVICCEPYQYERYDPQLLSQVPSAARIVRVKGQDPWRAFQTWRGVRVDQKLAGSSAEEARQVAAGHHAPWRSKLREAVRIAEAWVYRPDIAMPWIRPAVEHLQDACRQNRPNVIWATIGPLSAGVVAYRASVATEIPYVLDFRDPWGMEYYAEEVRRPAWARKVDHRIMCRMFERAQAVVFLFESIAECYVRAFPGALDRTKIHIIPNGFEGAVEDFVHVPGARCKVLYAGTLNSYRYETLLEGLVRLKRKDPERAKQLHLLFVGEGLQGLADRVADLDILDLVEIAPPTSHAEIRRLQQEAHALLVLGRTPGRKGHELVAGAKLFGYLQAGRPIIGIVPGDETRRILGQVGNSMIADADSPTEVVAVFERVIDAWSKGTLESLVPNRAACEAYSSSQQISALVAALDGAPPQKILTAESGLH